MIHFTLCSIRKNTRRSTTQLNSSDSPSISRSQPQRMKPHDLVMRIQELLRIQQLSSINLLESQRTFVSPSHLILVFLCHCQHRREHYPSTPISFNNEQNQFTSSFSFSIGSSSMTIFSSSVLFHRPFPSINVMKEFEDEFMFFIDEQAAVKLIDDTRGSLSPSQVSCALPGILVDHIALSWQHRFSLVDCT